MSEERSLQDVIQAAITAQDSGVIVNWQELCLQTYQVAMAEIKRLTPDPEEEDQGE